jgi:hypothetical protein
MNAVTRGWRNCAGRHARAFKLALLLIGACSANVAAGAPTPAVAVSPQYDTTHVYVSPDDFDRFTASVIATLGGSKSRQGVFQVTPTPSQTMAQLLMTPVGTFSVFGFKTPVPYPFGSERTGYRVTDLDSAVKSALALGATIVVSIFSDPLGRDAIIAWPGGVYMQLYWHTTAPNYAALTSVPENRIYLSAEAAAAFRKAFTAFSHGTVVADERRAPGIEIGRPGETYRRIRIESAFGKIVLMVTDGHLPYPYGRETTGYEVADLTSTLSRAKAAEVEILVQPYVAEARAAAVIRFPGGFIAEIHSPAGQSQSHPPAN